MLFKALNVKIKPQKALSNYGANLSRITASCKAKKCFTDKFVCLLVKKCKTV